MTKSPSALFAALALTLSGGAVLAQSPPSVRAQAPSAANRASLEGTWVLATSRPNAERAVDAAVDRAVNAMNFFVRAIARPRLREGTPIHRTIALTFDADQLTVRFSDGETYTTRLGRTERSRDPDGEALRITQRFRPDGSLEQVFQTDGGTRWYVYRPIADGRVRVEVVTNSPRMPEAMRFSLDYRRR